MVDWRMVRFCSGERSTFEATCLMDSEENVLIFQVVLFFDGCAVKSPLSWAFSMNVKRFFFPGL